MRKKNSQRFGIALFAQILVAHGVMLEVVAASEPQKLVTEIAARCENPDSCELLLSKVDWEMAYEMLSPTVRDSEALYSATVYRQYVEFLYKTPGALDCRNLEKINYNLVQDTKRTLHITRQQIYSSGPIAEKLRVFCSQSSLKSWDSLQSIEPATVVVGEVSSDGKTAYVQVVVKRSGLQEHRIVELVRRGRNWYLPTPEFGRPSEKATDSGRQLTR